MPDSGSARVADAALLAGWVFATNLVWESMQCVPFFVHGRDEGPFLQVMARAAAGDVVLTAAILVLVGIVSRKVFWWRGEISGRHWALVWAIAVPLAIAVERWALATGRWSYTDTNPVLPWVGVSVFPVVQLPSCLWASFRGLRTSHSRSLHP